MLPGKLHQVVLRLTSREGERFLLLWYVCTKTGRPVADFLQLKHPDTKIHQVGGPKCSAIERYEEVQETVPLDFSEYDVTWVVSKLSGAAGALGA